MPRRGSWRWKAIDLGWDMDASIPAIARIFIYLPLEYAEEHADARAQCGGVLKQLYQEA